MLERAWQPKACWMTRSKDSGHPPHATMGAVAWRICLPLLRSLQQTMMLPLFASEWIYVLFFFFLSSVFFLCSSIKIVLMKREGQLLTVLFKKRKFFAKLSPKLIANRFLCVGLGCPLEQGSCRHYCFTPSRGTAARALVDCAVRCWRLKFS